MSWRNRVVNMNSKSLFYERLIFTDFTRNENNTSIFHKNFLLKNKKFEFGKDA